MNEERMLKLADVIEAQPEHFDIRVIASGTKEISAASHAPGWTPLWKAITDADLTACGTSACYAGWAAHLWGADIRNMNGTFTEVGCELLGLDAHDTDSMGLFVAAVRDAHQAAGLLRDLVSGVTQFQDIVSFGSDRDEADNLVCWEYRPGIGFVMNLNGDR